MTASRDRTAKVWDAHTGVLRATLEGHVHWVNVASFSPDGHSIVTGSRDRTARVWDAQTGAVRATLGGHKNGVLDASFSPDGSAIVTASGDGTARVWDAQTGALRTSLEGHAHAVYAASFSSDGLGIVTISRDRTAKVWDARTGGLRATIEGHTDAINAASFTLDGHSIVTASADGTARVWDARTGALRTSLAGHADDVLDASFSPDGRAIVTANGDHDFESLPGTARVWDAQTGTLHASLEGHTGDVVAASFSPDGRSIVTAGEDGTAMVWDAQPVALRATLQAGDQCAGAIFSPDGRTIVTLSDQNRVWDAQTGALRATIETYEANDVQGASFSPDGRAIVAPGTDGTVRVWDARTGAQRATLGGPNDGGRRYSIFSPDGHVILTTNEYEGFDESGEYDELPNIQFKVWDTQTGTLRASLKGHTAVVLAARISPDGRAIVTASRDETAKVWDAHTGALRATLEGHTAVVLAASFSPDGRSIVTAGGDGTAKIWDAHTGALRATLQTNTDGVRIASFSPNGSTIVVAGWGGMAQVWDAETGALRAPLAGHTTNVEFVSFSPDGRSIVTACRDRTARVWDAQTGTLRARFEGTDGSVMGHYWDASRRTMSLIGQSGRIEHFRSDAGMRITSKYAIDHFDVPDRAPTVLYYTPDGLFTGDEAAFDRILYRLGPDVLHDDLVTADQLFERFHRSTLVEDFWAGRPLALPAGLENGVGRPPRVEFEGTPRSVRGEQTVTLRVRATDRGGGVGELRVFVNGARADTLDTVGSDLPASATSGGEAPLVEVDAPVRGDDRAGGSLAVRRTEPRNVRSSEVRSNAPLYGPGVHEVRVRLSPGENEISAEAYSVLGEVRGERARTVVRLEGVPTQPRRLFLVSVAVGSYSDPALSLRYTGADADAIASALGRQERRDLFDEVIPVALRDAGATRTNVLAALERVRREARPEDTLVVYIASHGVVGRCAGEARAAYHVVLYGASEANPCADVIDTSALTRELARIPAREKLLLLDTCQAGGSVSPEALRALRGDLRDDALRAARASGVAVIAGSAASQSSYEVAELEHGLFTVTLLRGLEGRAAFGGHGRVGVANLVHYVQRHLPILSERYVGRSQTPTYGAMGSDFAIAIVHEDDPPLLALRLDAPGEAAERGGFELSAESPLGQVQAHVDGHAAATAACRASGPLDVRAAWNVAGDVRFSVVGRGAGTTEASCVERALGTLRVEDHGSREGHVRVAVGGARTDS